MRRGSGKGKGRGIDSMLRSVTGHQELDDAVLKATSGKARLSLTEIGKRIDVSIRDLESSLQRLRDRGYDIELVADEVRQHLDTKPGGSAQHHVELGKGDAFKICVTSDWQLGNKTARLDILQAMYDHCKSEGITKVYQAGNVIDGYNARINAFELEPDAGPSIERQCEYAAKKIPKKPGIETYFITGDCHEGWYAKTSGLNVGKTMQRIFHQEGRTDLQYVGHLESDIELKVPGQKLPTMLRLLHPGGGTAYAKSYKTQKYVEMLQGGEKPHFAVIGHYHKQGYFLERNIHCILSGTLADQSIFMRKLFIPAEVGYWLVEVQPDLKGGYPRRVKVEWVPFFSKGFYSNWERF